jgi:YD repeat-containing protein
MRCPFLFVSACLTFSCGCAFMIAGAGKDLGRVESKRDMHAALGEPVAKGVADGREYEEFRTRKVIAEDLTFQVEGYGMAWACTLGTIDLVCVPYQCYLLGKRTLLGQTIRVTYDQEGRIVEVERDGESMLGLWERNDRLEGSRKKTSPPTASAAAPSPEPTAP